MFQNLKLNQKFNILLLIVFLVTVILSGVAFSNILSRNAEATITNNAAILMKTMLSVRDYTSGQINPLLAPRLETDTEFLPQTVPGYAAREVFETLRKNPEYINFFYKEATLNPTNLRDKADSFETGIVKQFREQSNLQELSGYRSSPAGELFYIARPIVITEQSCLRCHSTPQAAPKSQITTYGQEHGFGWKLNEIVGAQMISVPASGVENEAQQAFFLFMGIVTLAFALAILAINFLLRKAVTQPLNRIAKAANEVSMGNMEIEFNQTSSDEIGKLVQAFNRMKTSLVMAMKMLGRQE